MATTKIEWATDVWNPVTGCTKVSPGCDHCYAETFAERWRGTPGHPYEQGFDLTLRRERLTQPLRWRKPRRVFVNSMSDLFHDGISDGYIAKVFAVMALSPQHTFQVLTKRHGRMRSLLSSTSFHRLVEHAAPYYGGNDPDAAQDYVTTNWPLPNVWLGVSVESQQWADIRIPALLDTPAAVRWLSMEPLLGPVNLARYTGETSGLPGDWTRLMDWVVVGGESGPGARPMHPAWARSLRDQCAEAGVPFFFKQHGEWVYPEFIDTAGEDDVARDENGLTIWPDGRMSGGVTGTAVDGSVTVWRVGKKAAGRVLDGRTWDEYPAVANASA
jgi:protein gp37